MKNNIQLFLILGATALLIQACSGGDSATPGSGAGKAGSQARFAISNGYLYTVDDNSLHLFNIQDIEKPIEENNVIIGFGIETIFPFRNNLFIGSQDGMYVYDNSNPAKPTQLSSFTHARSCDPVVADTNFAYITLRSGSNCTRGVNQLDVVDIRDIEYPTLVKSYQMENPFGLGLEDSLLLVCDGFRGLKMYNAKHAKDSLPLLSTVTGIETYDVIMNNGIAVVVGKDGLYQYDYTNPKALKLVSKINVIY